MALTNQELAIRARNLLTERSPAAVAITLPHIVAMIPTALELWTREASRDPEKQAYLTKTFSPALNGGVLDLSNYINGTSGKISLQELRSTTIYTTIAGVRTPFTWVGSQAQLNAGRILGSDGPAIYLEGNFLRTKNTDGSLTSLGTATISFDVLNYPSSATDLPLALVGDFVTYLADYAVKEKNLDQ